MAFFLLNCVNRFFLKSRLLFCLSTLASSSADSIILFSTFSSIISGGFYYLVILSGFKEAFFLNSLLRGGNIELLLLLKAGYFVFVAFLTDGVKDPYLAELCSFLNWLGPGASLFSIDTGDWSADSMFILELPLLEGASIYLIVILLVVSLPATLLCSYFRVPSDMPSAPAGGSLAIVAKGDFCSVMISLFSGISYSWLPNGFCSRSSWYIFSLTYLYAVCGYDSPPLNLLAYGVDAGWSYLSISEIDDMGFVVDGIFTTGDGVFSATCSWGTVLVIASVNPLSGILKYIFEGSTVSNPLFVYWDSTYFFWGGNGFGGDGAFWTCWSSSLEDSRSSARRAANLSFTCRLNCLPIPLFSLVFSGSAGASTLIGTSGS